MYFLYSIDKLNEKYSKYIRNELQDLLKKLLKKLPVEIVENILENIRNIINYQWLELRINNNLIDSPLFLDFNINNYEKNCRKYLPEKTFAFIYNIEKLTLIFITGPNKKVIENVSYPSLMYTLRNKIDFVYPLNFLTFNDKKNLLIRTPEDLLNVKNTLEKINFEKFFKEVYLNKTWKYTINIKSLLKISNEILYKGHLMYKKYEEEDVGDTNEELNVIIENYWNKHINMIQIEHNQHKIINIEYFIKSLINFLYIYKGSFLISINDEYSICGYDDCILHGVIIRINVDVYAEKIENVIYEDPGNIESHNIICIEHMVDKYGKYNINNICNFLQMAYCPDWTN